MFTEINPEALSGVTDVIPENTPIVMLNLLRYNGEAGRKAYFEGYVPAFGAIAAGSEVTQSVHPIFIGKVVGMLAGPSDRQWDDCALVEYPSLAAFRSIVDSEAYRRDAEPHRKAALADWRLIVTVKPG